VSTAPEWFDPVTGQPLAGDDRELTAAELAERAERAARADAATIAARAARASLAAGAAGAAGALLVPPTLPELEPQPKAPPQAQAQAHAVEAVSTEAAADERYSGLRLITGILGRIVLAFVTGCLAVTLLPLLLGWHPYVVKSGSMEPRINVGDIVLASPDHDPKTLLGHVTVFQDPALPGNIKSHRVIALNPDGTMTTKGDANPTADPVPVHAAQVRGIGRLLVRWAGLPLIWAMTGQLLFLGLFLLVVLASAVAVARDHEDEDEDEDGDGDLDDADELDGTPAASPRTAARLERRARQTRRRRTVLIRAGASVIGAGALLVPGTSAAFSATTRTTASVWGVPAVNYTTSVNSYSPYLYWKLGDTNGTAADATPNGRTGSYAGSYTRGVVGGTPDTSPNTAVTATTSAACVNTTSTTAISAPSVLTEIIWFKTTAGYTGGGKLIGFESPRTGVGIAGVTGNYDRHIYLDGAGKVWFGVYNTAYQGVSSPASYNDGSWHMAAATISSAGMRLYVDGVLRASNSNQVAETITGWWRVGCGNLSGWGAQWTGANNPGTNSALTVNAPFLGSLDEASVFSGTALAASDISYLYWTR
jgi:signal peptidase I